MKQSPLNLIYRASLALKGEGIGCKVQLGNLGNNQINWRLRELHVGPTIRLRPLLV
jgi:hypothetical protein